MMKVDSAACKISVEAENASCFIVSLKLLLLQSLMLRTLSLRNMLMGKGPMGTNLVTFDG
jgi:hypothetical protein